MFLYGSLFTDFCLVGEVGKEHSKILGVQG
jgi:hypothetical protein